MQVTKAAILIDGGFLLKRLGTVQPDVDRLDPVAVADAIGRLIDSHLKQLFATHTAKSPRELLYRSFYYDAEPFTEKAHLPISGKALDYSKTDEFKFRSALFDRLRAAPNMAVRLGSTYAERQWVLAAKAQAALLKGTRDWASLTDADFDPGIRQKAVDMRLGLDIASISLKRQAGILVLVTGDSDFVPAAKLARREGVTVVLDPLWLDVRKELFEHIDLLRSGFPRPAKRESK